MIRQKEALETEVSELRKAKSVGDAKEQELQEKLTRYRKAFKQTSAEAAKIPELQSKIEGLNEQLTQSNSKIQTLTEKVNNARQLKESIEANKSNEKRLTESINRLTEANKTLEAKLEGQTKQYTQKLQEISKIISEIDVLQSFSLVTEKYNYTRPIINDNKEIKTENNTKAIMEECFKLLDNYKGVFVVESFDPRPLAWLKKNRKNIARGQLACATGGPESKLLGFLLTHLLLNFLSRPHFIAYEEEYIGKIPESVICIKLFGVAGFVWTVKEIEKYKKYKAKNLWVIFESFMP